MAPLTVFVHGSAGAVGKAVCETLGARGVRVLAGTRSAAKHAAEFKKMGVEPCEVDTMNLEALTHALQGVDKVFLMPPNGEDFAKAADVMVAACRAAHVKHIVRFAGGHANERKYIVGNIHRDAEEIIEKSGIPWTFVRGNNFYANILMQLDGIKQTGCFFGPYEMSKISIVDTRDIADAVSVVLFAPTEVHAGKAYEITGPESLDWVQIMHQLSVAVGKELKYVPIPDAAYKESLAKFLPPPFIAVMSDLARLQREGFQAPVSHDYTKLCLLPQRTWAAWCRENAHLFL